MVRIYSVLNLKTSSAICELFLFLHLTPIKQIYLKHILCLVVWRGWCHCMAWEQCSAQPLCLPVREIKQISFTDSEPCLSPFFFFAGVKVVGLPTQLPQTTLTDKVVHSLKEKSESVVTPLFETVQFHAKMSPCKWTVTCGFAGWDDAFV